MNERATTNTAIYPRCVMQFEAEPGRVVSAHISGDMDTDMLDAVESWVSRQRRRLAARRTALMLEDVWEPVA